MFGSKNQESNITFWLLYKNTVYEESCSLVNLFLFKFATMVENASVQKKLSFLYVAFKSDYWYLLNMNEYGDLLVSENFV